MQRKHLITYITFFVAISKRLRDSTVKLHFKIELVYGSLLRKIIRKEARQLDFWFTRAILEIQHGNAKPRCELKWGSHHKEMDSTGGSRMQTSHIKNRYICVCLISQRQIITNFDKTLCIYHWTVIHEFEINFLRSEQYNIR